MVTTFPMVQATLSMFDIECSFDHRWACEKDEVKQTFLKTHGGANTVFGSFEHMNQKGAFDIVSGTMKIIEYVMVAFFDFPCTSKSARNQKAYEFKTCIADGTGATGIGFKWSRFFIKTFWPVIVVLDNVTRKGDMGTFKKQMAAIDYETVEIAFDFKDYRSAAIEIIFVLH